MHQNVFLIGKIDVAMLNIYMFASKNEIRKWLWNELGEVRLGEGGLQVILPTITQLAVS